MMLSGRKDTNSHYDIFNLESMVDAVAFCKRLMRPEAQEHISCFALQFDLWYKMLSRASEEKFSDIDDGEGTAASDGEVIK